MPAPTWDTLRNGTIYGAARLNQSEFFTIDLKQYEREATNGYIKTGALDDLRKYTGRFTGSTTTSKVKSLKQPKPNDMEMQFENGWEVLIDDETLDSKWWRIRIYTTGRLLFSNESIPVSYSIRQVALFITINTIHAFGQSALVIDDHYSQFTIKLEKDVRITQDPLVPDYLKENPWWWYLPMDYADCHVGVEAMVKLK